MTRLEDGTVDRNEIRPGEKNDRGQQVPDRRSESREPPRQEAVQAEEAPKMQRGRPEDISPELREKGHETADVPPRWVLYAAAGLFVGLVVSGVGVAVLLSVYTDLRTTRAVSALQTEEIVPPAPRLEIAPWENRAQIERDAVALLSSYGWVDRQARIARVPVYEAMRLLAGNGWPDPFDPISATRPPGIVPEERGLTGLIPVPEGRGDYRPNHVPSPDVDFPAAIEPQNARPERRPKP